MATITDIEGIGGAYATKLRKAGVRSTEALLKMGGTKKGRKELAEATGFSTRRRSSSGSTARTSSA
jgi:hypothetical protein